MKKELIIGTRASKLALAQAEEVKNIIIKLNPFYNHNTELIKIIKFTTEGDLKLDQKLYEIGGKHLFLKEIEDALIKKKIDIAVHSAKDVPYKIHDSLLISAFTKRYDERDVFISKKYNNISDLPKNAVIGTSSSRRVALLLSKRPDLKIKNLRGNIVTRINSLYELNNIDGIIIALCGVIRIGYQKYITEILNKDDFLPAISQGSLAIEIRKDDKEIYELTRKINDDESELKIAAERSFMKYIDGSCKIPIAANAIIKDNKIHLKSMISNFKGSDIYYNNYIADYDMDSAKKIGKLSAIDIKKNATNIAKDINIKFNL